MSTKAAAQQAAQTKQESDQALHAAIGKQVMEGLGQPDELHKLDVRHLWKDNYRVNVLVGDYTKSIKVAHSFFLVTDGAGKVISSQPRITMQYHRAQSP